MKKAVPENKCFAVHENNKGLQVLWAEAIDIVRQAPQMMSATDFETKAFLIFAMIGAEINSLNLSVAYHSALAGENVDWFLARLDHQQTKAS